MLALNSVAGLAFVLGLLMEANDTTVSGVSLLGEKSGGCSFLVWSRCDSTCVDRRDLGRRYPNFFSLDPEVEGI